MRRGCLAHSALRTQLKRLVLIVVKLDVCSIFSDICHSGFMNVIYSLIVLLTGVYAGIISIAAADFERLVNPINLFLIMVGVVLIIGGVYFSIWIYLQPEPTF